MPLAVCNISLHLVDIDLTDNLAVLIILVWSVHMDIHDMLCNHLLTGIRKVAGGGRSNNEPDHAVRCVRL